MKQVQHYGYRGVQVIRSIVVTAGMLGVSFLTLVSFLNLQGYMNARPSADFVPPAYVRRLRIRRFARYSEPGENSSSLKNVCSKPSTPLLF